MILVGFHWVIMPTVDASPQNEQWIATYSDAEAVFNYSDWGYEVLKSESNGAINCLGSAPPSADEAYQPVGNKQKHKEDLGFDEYFEDEALTVIEWSQFIKDLLPKEALVINIKVNIINITYPIISLEYSLLILYL